ncbi:hypothetical protein PSEUDO9AG_40231 [Pseudomonas sp. 9Ag]|nr:hypothetical protein PSEUDO9AG_40231 [Pseudomonas sp. 9Ag]
MTAHADTLDTAMAAQSAVRAKGLRRPVCFIAATSTGSLLSSPGSFPGLVAILGSSRSCNNYTQYRFFSSLGSNTRRRPRHPCIVMTEPGDHTGTEVGVGVPEKTISRAEFEAYNGRPSAHKDTSHAPPHHLQHPVGIGCHRQRRSANSAGLELPKHRQLQE